MDTVLNIVTEKNEPQNLWDDHRHLATYNATRLNPSIPDENWEASLKKEHAYRTLENRMLRRELAIIRDQAASAPSDKNAFVRWFEDLKSQGPGQNSRLFDWLEHDAGYEEMKWFIAQEVAGEAGFEDLTAVTQVKMPTQAKLEMARNYWDEMGRGREPGMHGPMLSRIAVEFDLKNSGIEIVPETIALGNVMMGMALDRTFAFHSVGALGVIELTAPARAKKVHLGLKRLGISNEGQRYYLLHSALDIQHSIDWNREVLLPLLETHPHCARSIAEGALMRLNAGARCFKRYEEYFKLSVH